MIRRIAPPAHGVTLFLLVVVASAGPAAGQSAEEVLTTALERYEARIEDVDDYTVTQEVMGFTTTNRFVKKVVDGHPVFVSAEASADPAEGLPQGWGNPYRLIPELASRATMVGRTTVAGHEVWVIDVSDLEGLAFEGMTPGMVEGDFSPQRLSFQVGTEDHLLRGLSLRGEVTGEDDEARPVELDAGFRDYRSVGGMPHPYEIRVNVRGMASAMSDEQMARAREQLRQLRERLASMPAQQRETMERMMGPQLEKLEDLVRTGAVDVTVKVEEVRVNEGPPR